MDPAELSTSPEQGGGGQAETTPEGTTVTAPETTTAGQAEGEESTTTGQAETAPAEDNSFFDPKDVPPELQAAYKQMQGSFTRKMQALSEAAKANQEKIQAYDAFTQDPVANLQRMAQQYGMHLTRAEAQAQVDAHQEQQQEDWQPQSWDEVMVKATEQAREALLKELAPVLQTVQKVQAEGVEKQLDDLDPTWREYEDSMRANLQDHPSLAKDIGKLYRLSVPEEVLQSRATQVALKKLEAKTKSAAVGGKSTTRHSSPVTNEILSFDEAVQRAREQLTKG